MKQALLIFHLRPARAKARATAVAEALSLLRDLGATAPAGGPLSEQGGLFWISLPSDAVEQARTRLTRLGYTYAVDLLEPVGSAPPPGAVHWRGRDYRRVRLHGEDPEEVRAQAPDRRVFALETPAGVREIRGYRGDSGPLSRRGLPVADARMLVNLTWPGQAGTWLDPFAGAGGIVIAAFAHGHRVLSGDGDPALRYGLASLRADHFVADARRLPLQGGSVDAIATEPPYEREAETVVLDALVEMARVLRPGGRLAIFCAAWQAAGLRAKAEALGLTLFHQERIDRKGVDCAVRVWGRAMERERIDERDTAFNPSKSCITGATDL